MKENRHGLSSAVALPVALILVLAAAFWAPASSAPPAPTINHGGYGVQRDGGLLAAHNPDTPLVPASILKIATGLEALTLLGKDFRFETLCALGPDQTLYLKGTGDPMLVSEEIAIIAHGLRQRGVSRITGLVLDDSAFILPLPADGAGNSLNPYDVANSALAVNFNTINITVNGAGLVQSAEPQTPTLPIMARLGRKLGSGTHRINISANHDHIWHYTGELLQAQLRAAGIAVSGGFHRGQLPPDLPILYRHSSSKPLTVTVEAMLRYSNNFIANQLFLVCGAHQSGFPATWEKGRQALDDFLRIRVGLPDPDFTIEEGSGLSRKNRITPRAMLAVLNAFKPHADLLTLEKGLRLKSGTLKGVYSYAGYFAGPRGLDPFVLMLNQPDNGRDRLLSHLKDLHQRH